MADGSLIDRAAIVQQPWQWFVKIGQTSVVFNVFIVSTLSRQTTALQILGRGRVAGLLCPSIILLLPEVR